ncbi:hypothetical protein P8C59_003154 [Phyllachora maydis]|uniref:Uncharacterized protein n=1 Tax=Phyllachora maydis TaxID=1825666 RepID=A0AAD9MB58_9PEZI|nr:hypothetical protein P8C59_003154 [Phyllachora maydis]
MYIACSPYYYYCCDLSFTNLLIANIDSFSDLDNSAYTILGIPTTPPALAPIPAKLAKIMPAIRRAAASAAKRPNKDNNNAYNRAYMPPTNIKEEKGSSSNNNSINSSTSNSADKGKGSSAHKRNKGALYRKDTLPYKR